MSSKKQPQCQVLTEAGTQCSKQGRCVRYHHSGIHTARMHLCGTHRNVYDVNPNAFGLKPQLLVKKGAPPADTPQPVTKKYVEQVLYSRLTWLPPSSKNPKTGELGQVYYNEIEELPKWYVKEGVWKLYEDLTEEDKAAIKEGM